MKLQFLPTAFAPPYQTVDPFLPILAKTFVDLGPRALQPHSHGSEGYRAAAAAMTSAQQSLYRALATGQAVAYAYVVETNAFFRVPQTYYVADMWGSVRLNNKLSEFDNWRIPPMLHDADLLMLRDEAERWAGVKFDKLPKALLDKHVQMAPLGEGTLRKWFEALDPSERARMTEAEVLAAAQAAYPDNRISRERIRQIRGPQKPGPKQFGGELSAELPPK